MRIVAALGGNALLRRGQALTAENQRKNVRSAASAIAGLIRAGHELVISHGNGPQVGLLALQGAACKQVDSYPLDVLDAETEGMIGYMIEQELANQLQQPRAIATLLTQVEVDPRDAAFDAPSKPIGPVYSSAEADRLAATTGWCFARDGVHYRRVVPSPVPRRILELGVIRLLLDNRVIVICAGGGGIPVIAREDGSLVGVEAVVDKDRVSALLARGVDAGALLLLTDVAAVRDRFGAPDAQAIRLASPQAMRELELAPGSMGPKVEAACEFAAAGGGWAAIGRLEDAEAIVAGGAGTRVSCETRGMDCYPSDPG